MQTLAGLPSWAPVLVTVSCSIVVPLLLFRFSMSAKHLTNEPPMLPYWIPRNHSFHYLKFRFAYFLNRLL
jgi:hypothetical protein